MRVNISKSKFFVEKIEYLGYWITRQGIQPIRNKVEMNAILNIKAPRIRKAQQTKPVYWYSHLLSQYLVSQKWASIQVPLTTLTSSKVNFECHLSHQKAYSLLFVKAQYRSKAVYNHCEIQRVVISYWNLQGIKEYSVRTPFIHHSIYRP
jgi:hypothetical protein